MIQSIPLCIPQDYAAALGLATLNNTAWLQCSRLTCKHSWLCAVRSVYLEEGFPDETVAELKRKGHDVHANQGHHDRVHFGRGQIIRRDPESGVLWGGSDPRADGQVIGW